MAEELQRVAKARKAGSRSHRENSHWKRLKMRKSRPLLLEFQGHSRPDSWATKHLQELRYQPMLPITTA